MIIVYYFAQTKPSSSKGNDQSKVREFRTFNTVVGSQSKAEVLFTTPTQYSSSVESTLGIRISEREADLCCVAVVKRTWSLHNYTVADITNPDISWTSYCFISSITCDFRAICLSCSQSHDLVLFDMSNPSGQLDKDMFNNLYDSIPNTFSLYVL